MGKVRFEQTGALGVITLTDAPLICSATNSGRSCSRPLSEQEKVNYGG